MTQFAFSFVSFVLKTSCNCDCNMTGLWFFNNGLSGNLSHLMHIRRMISLCSTISSQCDQSLSWQDSKCLRHHWGLHHYCRVQLWEGPKAPQPRIMSSQISKEVKLVMLKPLRLLLQWDILQHKSSLLINYLVDRHTSTSLHTHLYIALLC